MFDSPIAFCPVCRQAVLLDQTQRECKAEHACGGVACPLSAYFGGYDFSRRPAHKKKERRHDAD